jgi:histidinol-phosphate/aromatic aminotransferase/cobyric acid decarboxylase-like protein
VDGTYEHPLKLDKRLLERKNIIIVKSFSKLGGVPGMRVGYCMGDKEIIDKMFVIKPLYEMCADAVKYLEFIMNPSGVEIIDEHIKELQKCYLALKEVNGKGFSIQGGNWATFEDFGKFKGRQHVIDSLPIVRVTLTDSKNAEQLLI